jgi:hypothetical protein
MNNTLDVVTSKQIGENGNIEYTWSNNIREKILQFNFQVVRTNELQLVVLENILRDILQSLKKRQDIVQGDEVNTAYLLLMYQMIGYTRDIIDGKGEYILTYMMIYVWYDFYPELAKFALQCLVFLDKEDTHPYGSWKDIKKFCQFCYNKTGEYYTHPLVLTCVDLINNQLKKDVENTSTHISLVAKWIPREKTKYRWFFKLLAVNYYPHYLQTAIDNIKIQRATKKCYMDYRKLLTELNHKLDTVQIKQCAKQWSTINFNNVTSITMSKQKVAFLNKNHKNDSPHFMDEDRIECAKHFNDYIKTSIKEGTEVKGKRVGMESFTEQALKLLFKNKIHPKSDSEPDSDPDIQLQIDLLNSQWRDNSSQTNSLGKMIVMVDVSGSMEGDALNVAIALGIRVAEKSILGKRLMTFASHPEWINLQECNDFVSCVDKTKNAGWGMNTNLYMALKMILDAIEENNMEPEDVQDLILTIFSDMQIDDADTQDKNTLYENISKLYSEAGIRTHGKPYKPPHVLFWNLRSTNGFPCLSNQPNISMLSGFNSSLLNLFCYEGFEVLQSCTPWSQLERNLNNKRYELMKHFALPYFE